MNKKEVLTAIKQHNFLDLSTINENGYPETRTMVNLLNPNINPHLREYFNTHEKIYIMTSTSSAKMNQIRNNSHSSIYFVDLNTFKGMLLSGDIKEITDQKIKQELWHDSWYEYYKDGLNGGDFSLLEFTPNHYKTYGELSVKSENISW